MKVKIGNEVKEYKNVWMEGNIVKVINHPKLPHFFEITELNTHKETANAIKTMIIHGAGAIGVTAGFGMAQAALEAPDRNFDEYISEAANTLKNTRPTAQNLFYAIDRVIVSIKKEDSVEKKRKAAIKEAQRISNDDEQACRKIGEYGKELIKNGYGILTHCVTGGLAFVDYGSALSPIKFAHYEGKKIFVFIDETRPKCQGARLTAWELLQEGIPHAIIVDNAAGYYMNKGDIDICIVGADRVASNGDVANKIGTYEKAVLAKENGIPFYAAFPLSTIDLECPGGNYIPIEERSQDEVLYNYGKTDSGEFERVRVSPLGSQVKNPSFDVTPAKYITGLITPRGIIKPTKKNILGLFK
ncbi:MAG: S-methyl-5-thioribose-1-phosphate isomerase [Candidatus Aenigmarchaeota archaeon CG_4_10_14_0_8_um_filter_37_24]|nr:S-methyl-5-thioribose-1-phosphate isomerase [Candidatus Aenigmarchaeota archaeon]OIN88127.1 MAG: S-methyl-5-thioribose-1-phosphate isomerase [Candidatus Aenigmarchaeota archaeon CG1_02_38_14]PIV69544.1 MAG: S-methyl-5-thioribose-1-phosphate isomerase [Candidatus Aenigmarchaeota archaeon CG01_land_8_20_14_3_00_37_9]PIW41197.1 MAG: S-methyl-5-thioribose-1-phosphate isomerase [Candidatus Aenigmarchaeota archaeon CG15_BIG_FIL_POST_REV_8_21_14_020_37_27]PIX50983.1 MAG: S-methyl-5-thioribose-1-pho